MAKRPKRDKKRELERAHKSRRKRRERSRDFKARLTPRGEYTLFEHPNNVFRIEFPSHWEHSIEDKAASICFWPKGRDNVALSCYITPYSIDAEAIAAHPNAAEACEKMFEKVNALNPRRDATIPYFAMKADRNQEGMGGYYWLVAACDIFLWLSTYCPEGELHLWNPIFERMLSTFRIPRELEAVLTKVITRLLRKLNDEYPDQKYELEDWKLHGKNRKIPLGNLVARVRRHPGDWEELTDDFFDSAVKVMHFQHLGREQLDDVRDEIFPFIRSDGLGGEEGRLVKSEWLANLSVTYVIRIPKGFRYITEHDLERWSLEREELHQLAITNLCNLDTITTATLSDFPTGALPFVMVAAGDNMEASRLLNPGLYGLFAESLGGPFIAAIPCRDALILFPNDKDLRRAVQQIVRDDYATSDHAITDRLFLVTPDGATLAEW